MALLAGKAYDPATAVSLSLATATAMTAFDTTNLRLTFTVPASGNVFVRIKPGVIYGNTAVPSVLLGVLDGSTVVRRVLPARPPGQGTTQQVPLEAAFTVTGLTPAASVTWDAAYGIEVNVAATLMYGGPDDTTASNAGGAFLFEIWEA